MLKIADYLCLECKEILENSIQAVKHSSEFKHENYELIGSEQRIIIKMG
jgi:hypothetical protein